jgi:hypothetical protein
MKKVSIFVIKLLSSFILCVWLSLHLQAQKAGSSPFTAAENKDSEQLAKEIIYMSDRAAKLRTHSRLAEGETRDLMLRDAAILEGECLAKQLKYSQLYYGENLQAVEKNRAIIVDLQKTSAANENQMHIKFLLDASEKNTHSASEIYEEASSQPNQVLKLASLENAAEKIDLAREQQEEAIVLLKRGSTKIAKDR